MSVSESKHRGVLFYFQNQDSAFALVATAPKSGKRDFSQEVTPFRFISLLVMHQFR